ncbi:MAG: hypothetical protein ABWZ80_07210, partial [Beijerinckiaceae bacterium]
LRGVSLLPDRRPLDACVKLEFHGGLLKHAPMVGNYFGECDNLTEDLTSEFQKYREDLAKPPRERRLLKTLVRQISTPRQHTDTNSPRS